jgi:hypothetical protein
MGPPVRRQIRPVRIIPFEDVEDQLWPINLLVVVLAGFVVGLILGLSRFDDPRLFYNAYFQLFTVGLTLGVWFLAIRWVRGRLKQRLKIAALFSLVAHLWLLLSLGVGYYRVLMQTKPNQDKVEEIAELRVPEYPESVMEQGEAPSPYHRPVETVLPVPQMPEAPKQVVEGHPPRVERPSAQVPKPPEPKPTPLIPGERREVSPPHRAESIEEPIRRQIAEARQEPIPPAPLPEIRPAAPPKRPEAAEEVVRRQPPQSAQPQRPQPTAPVVERPAPLAVTTPRPASQTPAEPPASEPAGPNRQVRPAPEPVLRAESPPPPAASRPQETASVYQPRTLAIPRQENRPVDRKSATSVSATPPQTPAGSAVVHRNMAEPIQIAQLAERLPARQLPQAVQTKVPEEPLPQPAAAPEVRLPLGPVQTQVARQQPSLGHLADRAGLPERPSPVAPDTGQVAVATTHRPGDSAPSGWQMQAGPAEQMAPRTAQQPPFEAAAEQARLEAPVRPASPASVLEMGRADAVSLPLQPRTNTFAFLGQRTAQAWTGTAHPVTGGGLPEPASAARRVQASLQGEEGLETPEQKTALLPRRQTGTPAPSGLVPHEEASLAGAAGSAQSSGGDQISQWEAGSQSVLPRQAPGAPLGQTGRGSLPGRSPLLAGGPGPGGVVTTAAKPSEGGMGTLPFGQRPELGRSTAGPAPLAGLDGKAAETVLVPAPGAGSGTGNAQTGTGQLAALQPGNVSVGRTAIGRGLPGARSAGEVSWQIPAGSGGVVLGPARRGGAGFESTIQGDQAGGIPGPARQMARLPTQDLAGKVPEIGTSAGEGSGSSKGGAPSEGTASTSLEPVVPGGERLGSGASGIPEGLLSGRPGGVGPTGSQLTGIGGARYNPAEGVSIGSGTGKGRAGRPEESGLGNALAGTPLPRAVRGEIPGTGLEPIAGGGGLGDQPGSKAEGSGVGPAGGPGSPTGSPNGMAGSLGGDGVEVARQGGGLPVHVAARPGVGGLSPLPSPMLGVPSRRAHPDSEEVHLGTGRFLLERSGSRVAFDARAEPAEAFRQRHPTRRGEQAQKYGGSEASEQAVERGLAFLAKLQWPDGRWRFHALPDGLETWAGQAQARQQPELLLQMAHRLLQQPNRWQKVPEIHQRYQKLQNLLQRHAAARLDAAEWAELAELVRQAVFFPGVKQSDSAATGLALLAFLGAGYTHQEGPYQSQVQRALQWLLANQKSNGDLWGYTQGSANTWLYSHGMAAIALCEAYGMTKDPGLREPTERAIGFIVAAQHPTLGGWRYQPREDSDTSVSGWMLMALKSAQMAGLAVPQSSLDLVSRWLDLAKASDRDGSRYVYNPLSRETGAEFWFHRTPTAPMTAEALLMRMYLGWNREHPLLQAGADFLLANLPDPGTPDRPTRDAYYWYYATQVMFQMGGRYWDTWNGKLRPYLETSQIAEGPLAGSWDPSAPVPDRFAHEGGRLYVTAMHLLMLEVYYRHLPLFKTLREEPAR